MNRAGCLFDTQGREDGMHEDVNGQEEKGMNSYFSYLSINSNGVLRKSRWINRIGSQVETICGQFSKLWLWCNDEAQRVGKEKRWRGGERANNEKEGKKGEEKAVTRHFYIMFLILTLAVDYLEKCSQLLEPCGYPTRYKPTSPIVVGLQRDLLFTYSFKRLAPCFVACPDSLYSLIGREADGVLLNNPKDIKSWGWFYVSHHQFPIRNNSTVNSNSLSFSMDNIFRLIGI